MNIIDCIDNVVKEIPRLTTNYKLLPDDSLVLVNLVRFCLNPGELTLVLNQVSSTKYKFVFIDASYDPILYNDTDLLRFQKQIQEHFFQSKVVLLSGNCRHYFVEHPAILWYPFFGLSEEYKITRPLQTNKRIGCLNRRNAPHRIWLMHNLLKNNYIDHYRDIYSVQFNGINGGHRCDIGSWLPIDNLTKKIIDSYPEKIATIDDGFINDYSLNHPAWSTPITIVTETEVGDKSLVTEKTFKALASNTCSIFYTGIDALNLLKDFEFILPFDKNSHDYNITPIVDICKNIDTVNMALDFHDSKKHILAHNHTLLKFKFQHILRQKINFALDNL